MLETRLLNDDDYDILVSWWNDNNFPPPPKEMLPNNGTGGIIITKEGVNICAGFLYTTNSKIAWLEWVVADKNYRDKDRKQAIILLINGLCNLAQELGFKAIFTSVKNPFLINHFKNTGFTLDSNKSSEMVKKL